MQQMVKVSRNSINQIISIIDDSNPIRLYGTSKHWRHDRRCYW